MTTVAGSPTWSFSNQGTVQVLNSAGVIIRLSQIIVNSPNGGVSLTTNTAVDLSPIIAPNVIGAVTLTAGTLDLNNNTLTTVIFSSSGATTRSFAFGTGKIVITGTNTTVWSTNNSTGLTMTGSKTVEFTGVGVGGQVRAIQSGTTATGSIASAPNMYFQAGADTLNIGTTNRVYETLDFTGFSGTTQGDTAPVIYGDLVLSTSMTVLGGTNAWIFAATTPQTITTNGKTIANPITFDGIGGTWTMQDALTLGSTRTLTLTNGTLDLNGFTLTTGLFSSTNSNVRTLAFGTGNIVLTATSGTIFTTSTSTNLTVTGTNPLIQATVGGAGTRTIIIGAAGEANAISVDVTAGSDTIVFATTSGAFKNVNFTGFTGTYNSGNNIICYGNWNWGGVTSNISTNTVTFASTSGTKTITSNSVIFGGNVTINGIGGTWECQDALSVISTLTMTNGTLKLKSGTTSTVGAFATSGTNPKYLYATTSGTQATISDASGTNSVNYLTIQDSNATGGALFRAFTSNFNVDAGNNTGWKFSNNGGTFLVFF
jgi:hypothetical protein